MSFKSVVNATGKGGTSKGSWIPNFLEIMIILLADASQQLTLEMHRIIDVSIQVDRKQRCLRSLAKVWQFLPFFSSAK